MTKSINRSWGFPWGTHFRFRFRTSPWATLSRLCSKLSRAPQAVDVLEIFRPHFPHLSTNPCFRRTSARKISSANLWTFSTVTTATRKSSLLSKLNWKIPWLFLDILVTRVSICQCRLHQVYRKPTSRIGTCARIPRSHDSGSFLHSIPCVSGPSVIAQVLKF